MYVLKKLNFIYSTLEFDTFLISNFYRILPIFLTYLDLAGGVLQNGQFWEPTYHTFFQNLIKPGTSSLDPPQTKKIVVCCTPKWPVYFQVLGRQILMVLKNQYQNLHSKIFNLEVHRHHVNFKQIYDLKFEKNKRKFRKQ